MTPSKLARIAAQYRAGQTLAQLAERHGTNEPVLSIGLRAIGCPMRSRGPKPKKSCQRPAPGVERHP